ncbi:MAG: LamG domain-containing protein [Deltaproteobacteria bacterium]|nr:LamG domain-containing protein [Deltaproteobacteria bacterium]
MLTLNDSIVGNWRMEESVEATAAQDSSGHVHNSVYAGSGSSAYPEPPTEHAPTDYTNGRSRKFFAAAQRVYSISTATEFQHSKYDSHSISLWVKLPYLPGAEQSIFTFGGDSASYAGLGISAANKWSYLSSVGDTESPATATTGSWVHIVLVQNADDGTQKIYVDGTEAANNAAFSTFNGADKVEIGGRSFSDNYFSGMLEEVRYYRRALSAAEVSSLAQGTQDATSATVTLAADIFVARKIELKGHTLAAANKTINLAGDFEVSGGAFSAGTGILTLSGQGVQIITVPNTTFHDVISDQLNGFRSGILFANSFTAHKLSCPTFDGGFLFAEGITATITGSLEFTEQTGITLDRRKLQAFPGTNSFFISVPSEQVVYYVTVQNSDALGANIVAVNSQQPDPNTIDSEAAAPHWVFTTDTCVSDPNKYASGVCGHGVADTDSDSDGTPDCNDACDNDANKTTPGTCGCNVADVDSNNNGIEDCEETAQIVTDGDGVQDAEEITDGTDPNDSGSFLVKNVRSGYLKYNTFLGYQNYLELSNIGTATGTVTLRPYNANGQAIGGIYNYAFAASAQHGKCDVQYVALSNSQEACGREQGWWR